MISKTCFFTIVSNNYRHFARTLVASVREHNPDLDAYVAICDDPLATSDSRDDFTELSIRDLGLPQFDRFTFQYTILELNTAIKPWVIEALFERGYERVIYFDPDIRLYGSVAPILARLQHANIVVTPHLTDRLDDGRSPTELAILQSGSYNLGFIALRWSDETRRFVSWWQNKLLRDCVVDIPRGLFTDQKWIDLVPGMYDGVAIERDAGWNVAYWNLNHRAVSRNERGGVVVNGRPLLFLHYSGYAPGARLFSKHQDRFTMENLPPVVRELADDYGTELQRNGINACRQLPYAFGQFLGGEPIPDLVRRCYREDSPADGLHPDLWTKEGQAFVIDWLNQPAPEHGRVPWLTRLASKMYRLRPDLQAAFPAMAGAHGRSFAHWFVEHAGGQEKIPEMFVAPVRAALHSPRKSREADAAPISTDLGSVSASEETQAPNDTRAPRRLVYRIVYRLAWVIRHAVKPLTTQSFRHRVRHALLRKAYFDENYSTPPLVPTGVPVGASMTTPAPANISYTRHQPGTAPVSDAEPVGINVIGYLSAESGIGESARSMLRILSASSARVTPINFRVGNMSRATEAVPLLPASDQLHAVNLFHINADQMFVARDHLGASLFEGRYNIGFWAWELPDFPDEWVPAFGLLNEVWVPSAFCQQAIALKSPVPVLRVPHSVAAPTVSANRQAFGLRGEETAFFTMCDVLSVPERKNPLAVVDAFRLAFPGNETARLLLKIGNLEYQPDLKSRLRDVARQDPRITLIEGYLSREKLWTLMASIDCFVSLHRAEGFGLGMAEAMACGKAVIATGWSGNVDFTRSGNALLVDYSLVELTRDLGPYRRGQAWADPDIDMAAGFMRDIQRSSDLRQRLAVRGRATVADELSPRALAPLVEARLRSIRRARISAPSHF